MAVYDAQLLKEMLTKCVESEANHSKGEALADLVEEVFTAVPSVHVLDRNHLSPDRALEVDLIFAHTPASGLALPGLTIQVECKNEVEKISASQVRDFAAKLRNRNRPMGVMVSRTGLSGQPTTAAHKAVSDELVAGRSIVVLVADELAALGDTDELVELIHSRLAELELDGRYSSV